MHFVLKSACRPCSKNPRMQRATFMVCAFVLLLLLGPMHYGSAAEPANTTKADTLVNPGTLEAKIKEVESAAGLDDTTRATLTGLYRSAITFLERAGIRSGTGQNHARKA
jgi:hypothetical protein